MFTLRKPQAESYPLICIVEPYAGAEPRTIDVDFFIINLTAKEYTRVELQDLLRGLGSEPGHQQSSVIELNAKSPAKLAAARNDTNFNEGKGKLSIEFEDGAVRISVEKIRPRAIMKIILSISNPHGFPGFANRVTKAMLPREFIDYQQGGCFTTRFGT